ncbi:MAG: hypothetical protein ACRDTD_00070 [Pseudonocardiaceae bacterium]
MQTHPDNNSPQQEVWTEHALSQGMRRIGHGVHQLPNLGKHSALTLACVFDA